MEKLEKRGGKDFCFDMKIIPWYYEENGDSVSSLSFYSAEMERASFKCFYMKTQKFLRLFQTQIYINPAIFLT